MGVGVALIGPDMRIMALNKTMGLWFPGLDPSKQPICYMAYGNPSGDGPCLRCPARQTLADGRKHESVGDRLTPSGLRHYRLTSAALNDEDGRPIAAVEIMDDITELKRAEQAVGEHEQFHQAIIDGIPIPVFFKDTNGVYLGCNEAFAAFVGMPRKKIIGGSAYDVSLGELDKYLELDGDLAAGRQTRAYECRATRGDGTVRHVVFNKTRLIKADGAVGGLVGVICDPAKEVGLPIGSSSSMR